MAASERLMVEEYNQWLAGLMLFKGVDPTLIFKIASTLKRHELSSGDVIIQEAAVVGDADDGSMYFIMSGSVDIYRKARAVDQHGCEEIKDKYLASLRDGNYFGENASPGIVRSATVTAGKDGAIVLGLSMEGQSRFFDKQVAANVRKVQALRRACTAPVGSRTAADIEALKQLTLELDFFRALPMDALAGVCQQLEYITLPPKTAIVRQGDIGDSLFVIITGGAKVSVRAADDLNNGIEQDVVVAALSQGTFFGEMALLKENSRRGATITTTTITELMVLHKETYNSVLVKYQVMGLAEKVAFVQNCAALQGMQRELTLTKLCCVLSEQTACKGDVLFKEGTPCKGLYILVQGTVEISKHIAEQAVGDVPLPEEIVVTSIGPHEVFGDVTTAVQSRTPRHDNRFDSGSKHLYSATVHADVRFFLLPSSDADRRLTSEVRKRLHSAARAKLSFRQQRLQHLRKVYRGPEEEYQRFSAHASRGEALSLLLTEPDPEQADHVLRSSRPVSHQRTPSAQRITWERLFTRASAQDGSVRELEKKTAASNAAQAKALARKRQAARQQQELAHTAHGAGSGSGSGSVSGSMSSHKPAQRQSRLPSPRHSGAMLGAAVQGAAAPETVEGAWSEWYTAYNPAGSQLAQAATGQAPASTVTQGPESHGSPAPRSLVPALGMDLSSGYQGKASKQGPSSAAHTPSPAAAHNAQALADCLSPKPPPTPTWLCHKKLLNIAPVTPKPFHVGSPRREMTVMSPGMAGFVALSSNTRPASASAARRSMGGGSSGRLGPATRQHRTRPASATPKGTRTSTARAAAPITPRAAPGSAGRSGRSSRSGHCSAEQARRRRRSGAELRSAAGVSRGVITSLNERFSLERRRRMQGKLEAPCLGFLDATTGSYVSPHPVGKRIMYGSPVQRPKSAPTRSKGQRRGRAGYGSTTAAAVKVPAPPYLQQSVDASVGYESSRSNATQANASVEQQGSLGGASWAHTSSTSAAPTHAAQLQHW